MAGGGGSRTNSVNSLDVNNDGFVSPVDALLVINQINSGLAAPAAAAVSSSLYMDVNGDKYVTAGDALMVINYLNSYPAGGEGEGEGQAVDAALSAADYSSQDVVQDELLGLLAAETATARPRVLRSPL